MKLMADKWRPSRAILARSRALPFHLAEILWQRMLRLEARSNSRATRRSAPRLNQLQFARDVDRRSRHQQKLNNTKQQVTCLFEIGATAAWLGVAVPMATQRTLQGERVRYLRLRWTTATL